LIGFFEKIKNKKIDATLKYGPSRKHPMVRV